MNLDDVKHLWEDKQAGWSLLITDQGVWHLQFQFALAGPSQKEIINLRKVLPELKTQSLPHTYGKLKACSTYTSEQSYGNIEARHLYSKASSLGLQVTSIGHNIGTCKAKSNTGDVLLICDLKLGRIVAERMSEAGLRVGETHVD